MKTNRPMMVLALLAGLLLAQNALAFYNPQAGRWLNRDPIAERGGLNLYIPANNDMIRRVDKLGLMLPDFPISQPPTARSCGRCGPDVTDAVARTLEAVQDSFLDDDNPNYRVSDKDDDPAADADTYRRRACKKLFSRGHGETAWEISPLGRLGVSGNPPKDLPPGITPRDFGTGECDRTVVYRGRCVWASALNYIIFGKASKLCSDKFSTQPFLGPYGCPVNWSLLDVRLAVLYHKWNAKGGLMGNPEAVAALEFAEEGYTGSAPGAYKTGPSCDSSGVKTWPNQPMPWSWSGVHTYQAPR
jgi:hypothetical protein